MAISDLLNRRVRARPEEEEEDDYSVSGDERRDEEISEGDDDEDEDEEDGSEGSLPDTEEANSDPEAEQSEDDEEGSDSDSNSQTEDFQSTLNNISFGALAKAQSSMGPKKQKKTSKPAPEPTSSPLDDIRARIRAAREKRQEGSGNDKDRKKEMEKRSSKHAPTVQSSKHAVSRKRTIIEPPAIQKSRDPRFDPTIRDSGGRERNSNATNKNYAFLDDYRASELKDLKAQLAKTKDPDQKEALKREIRSNADRIRAIENKRREQGLMAEHKKNEKQMIREGKKSNPYFLKKSDLKKQVLMKKYEEMGSRDRAKALERRRKKVASKERKEMPWERRGFEGGADEGRKRRRLE